MIAILSGDKTVPGTSDLSFGSANAAVLADAVRVIPSAMFLTSFVLARFESRSGSGWSHPLSAVERPIAPLTRHFRSVHSAGCISGKSHSPATTSGFGLYTRAT